MTTTIQPILNPSPLSDDFDTWSEPWGRLGLWVSLWDATGESLNRGHTRFTFWQTLDRHAPGCHHRLAELARRVAQGQSLTTELAPHTGILVSALPVRSRRGAQAVVTLFGLTDAFFDDETIARFCSRYELDRLFLQRLANQVPTHPPDHLDAYTDVIQQQLDRLATETVDRKDITGLSSQLANAYEQLNLLYRISADMIVSRQPTEHFEQMCAELLNVTQVGGFATVLHRPDDRSAEPIIVTVGDLEADEGDIRRLYQQIQDVAPNVGTARLMNDIANTPAFAWAESWLRQFVFFNLATSDQVFGGIFAINRRDEGDFDSEEVQFINALAERSSAFLENTRLYDDLEALFMSMLRALVSSIDAKDPYTCGHSQRVAWLSRHIAQLSGMPEHESQRVYLAGLLHDIGKIGISEAVLCKTGRLTPKEFDEMKRHPVIGARIVQNVRQVQDLIPAILHHHERLDGNGYPHGLAGAEVPLLGRIVGIADSFDAMTTNRTYRKAQPIPVAVAELRRCSGTQFDPELTDLFLKEDLEDIMRKMARAERLA